MKTYIVYGKDGKELGTIKAKNHNKAESKAFINYGAGTSVAYTEV